MEPPDLVGMPQLDGKSTRFLPPAFLPTDGKGLLVFEELNRCATYMRAPCLQLLTARTLNDYVLPPGWLPCAAVNPPGGDYDVSELDPALLSRFVQIGVVADHKQWLAWAEANGVHPDVLSYVARDPKIFEDTNPRSWKYVSDLLKAADAEVKTALETVIAGVIGAKRAIGFKEHLKGDGILRLPPADALLTQYKSYAPLVKKSVDKGQTDVLAALAHSVQVLIQPQDAYEEIRNDDRKWKALGNFLADLPPDLADAVRKNMRERDYEQPPKPRGKK
jgi:hypothetical protein